jgi:luciferase family oxidoreductase group 1
MELRSYFRPAAPGQLVKAVPGAGLNIPIYLLGSSDFSARLAAELGLPFAFASHFAPDYLLHAIELYRKGFKPSAMLDRPHVIIGVNVFCADTDEEAHYLFTSVQQQFLNLIRGEPRELPPPIDAMEWNQFEEMHVARMTRCSAVGSPETVRQQLTLLLDQTGADEIIATAQIFDHAARLHSFELAAGVFEEINSVQAR